MQSRPQSRHLQQLLEPPDHSSYFDQQTWMQDHPAGQHDAHISWPAMDVNFDLHDGERCTSTLTQNNELSRESPINGYLNGVDKAPVQASSEFFVSPQVREQFSHFSSTGTCHPALLTPPTSSSSTVRIENPQRLFINTILTIKIEYRSSLRTIQLWRSV